MEGGGDDMFNELERSAKLITKAGAYLGMIAEVESKARLYKAKINSHTLSDISARKQQKEVRRAIRQMKKDLAKYTRRIEKIHEELRSYGIFSDLD
jgi:uncharacterized coiled-coil DUF342 family protein